MFNTDTCKGCGTCLTKCPFLALPRDEARKEVAALADGKGKKESFLNCAGCGYCNIICPTQSNPSHIRREAKRLKSSEKGVNMLSLMTDDVPLNLMSIGLAFEKHRKEEKLKRYAGTKDSKEVFYLGCSLSYIHTDLTETSLLRDLPMIGGMEFCCGGYVHTQFSEAETAAKGRQLLHKLKQIGVERLVSFCPECENMISQVYPSLIPEFDIKSRNFVQYFLDSHELGQADFKHPINKKVTVHDSCAFRNMDPKIHEEIRRLLTLLGAEVVEMKHNKTKTMCCGAPLAVRNPALVAEVTEKRALEAKATEAEMMVVGCTGCFNLAPRVEAHGMEIFHILELLQMAIGETPPHRINTIRSELANGLFTAISEQPELLKQRFVIKNGNVVAV